MKKIVILPDSFKGTMSSREVGEIIAKEARKVFPDVELIRAEVADGGEGTVDAFLSVIEGKKIFLDVPGPEKDIVRAHYGLFDDFAVVEMAAAAGLPLVKKDKNPGRTTTLGVGVLIDDAIRRGVKKVIIGLGGSATNDGACGLLHALGAEFYDAEDKPFIPTGDTLKDIRRIDIEDLNDKLHGIELSVMCDIDNPLCGENGAAHIFAPQKGADPEQVLRLDAGLCHFAKVIEETTGKDVLDIPGAGAAGGMGGGLAGLTSAQLTSGIEVILDNIHFDDMLNDCSLVITGEGRIDGQSLRGKVVYGIAKRAAGKNVPVIAVVGDIANDAENLFEEGLTAIFSINRVALPYEKMKPRAPEDLAKTIENIFRFSRRLLQ